MANTRDEQSPLEKGQRDTQIRRDTDVRGSMGVPPSGRDTEKVTPETDVFQEEQEEVETDRETGGTHDES